MSQPAPTPYAGRIMISSAMRGYRTERLTLAALIVNAGLVPWYAENPPDEFRGVSSETVSFEMAARCDLYLLIIFSRYGSQVLPADTRAVTELEFERARSRPRRVRVFVAQDALDHADTAAFRAFIHDAVAFQSGIAPVVFTTPDELNEAVGQALERWQTDGEVGRKTYLEAVQTEYARFRNPATGQEMEYSATVQLKARALLTPTRERPEWGDQEDEEREWTRTDRERARSERDKARERLHEATQSPPALASTLLAQHQRLVMLGDVGSGKSTLLKRLVHDTAEAYQRGQESRIPILVTATRLGAMARQHAQESLAEVAGRVQEEETRTEALRPTIRSTISNALANGQALLLVDGLDEAAPSEQTALLTLLAQIGANWAILASRPSAYRGQPAGWQVADLLPLGKEQRRELVLQVFCLERQDDETPPSEEGLAGEADELEGALRARQSDLAAWGGNPLLLTLIAVQFIRDHRLPENRAHIYEFAIEDLQRQRPTNARRYLTSSQLQRLLQTLSLRMQEALRRSATVAEVRDTYLHRELGEFSEPPLHTAVALEILRRAGVLQTDVAPERGEGTQEAQEQDNYAFVHLSFREYLAARAIARLPDAARQALARRHALQAEWEQVFLLLVSCFDASGRAPDADALIQTLIAADARDVPALEGRDPTHLALRLATHCAAARGKQPQEAVWDALRAVWWRLWRAEERRYRGLSEGTLTLLTLFGQDDQNLTVTPPPPALCAGMPLLLGRLNPRRQFPRARWWVWSALITLIALGVLLLVAQVSLSIPPFAASGWGTGLAQRLPVLVLAGCGVFAALRLYGGWARASVVRHAMFLSTLHEIDTAVLGTLASVHPRALKPLLSLLRDSDSHARIAAAGALGRMRDAALEPLFSLLHDADRRMRSAAARALGQLGDARILEPLLPLLQDPVSDVRRAVAQALGQLGDARALKPLIPVLRDAQRYVRGTAVDALGRLGDARALKPLIRRTRRQPWGWVDPPLALLHRVTDWPLLLGVLLAQITLLVPAVAALLPPSVVWLLGLTAWWQVALLVLLWGGAYWGGWVARLGTLVWVVGQDYSLVVVEQLIRRQAADTQVKPTT